MKSRNGLTLIELLMVITILVTVTAAAIPMLATDIETRRVREAARGVSGALGKARALAIESGRPAGVLFSASSGFAGDQASTLLQIVEVPPAFCGWDPDAGVELTRVALQAGDPANRCRFTVKFGSIQVNASVIPPDITLVPEPIPTGSQVVAGGDKIQLDYKNFWFTFGGSGWLTGNDFEAYVDLPQGSSFPVAIGSTWEPQVYKILGQPRPSASQPYSLPTGAVVDLYYSGIGSDTFSSLARPVGILFASSGEVDRVFYSNGTWQHPLLPVHFLIGKSENLPVASNGGNDNWKDLQNLWVSLNGRTGRVVSSEVASGVSPDDSRRLAKDLLGMGGK